MKSPAKSAGYAKAQTPRVPLNVRNRLPLWGDPCGLHDPRREWAGIGIGTYRTAPARGAE